MAPRYPCAQCGSSSFEEDDGIWYCHNGHEQEGGQQIEEDAADYGKGGKVIRRKEVREKQKRLKIYRGNKGFELYLKAWQHILWRQCHALIQNYNLPNELWTLVRELWSLRLTLLIQRLVKSIDDDVNQATELSTTSESGQESDVKEPVKTFKTSKHAKDNPSLPDTISLIYIGIILLRHPTTLATIYDHIRQERICYIRAIRYVPEEIRDRLAPEYHEALDTTTIPTRHDLQLAVHQTTRMYMSEFEMVIPSLNWILMLFEHIEKLALPLEVFPAVKVLAGILQYDFAYPRQHIRRNATTFPESQLMALIVVATKLLYPFDAETATSATRSVSEPSAMKFNWQAWLDAKRTFDAETKTRELTPKEAIGVTDIDILRMSEDKIDEYMDWFQRTYTKESKSDNLYNDILNMFPLQTLEASNRGEIQDHRQHILTRLQAIQAELRLRTVMSSDEEEDAIPPLRPGQRYQQYRSVEEMSETILQFHREAAELACLDIDALLRACLRTEKMLMSYQHEQRRTEQDLDKRNEAIR